MITFLLAVAVALLLFDRVKLKAKLTYQLTAVTFDKELYWTQYLELKEEKEERLHKIYREKYKWIEVSGDDPCNHCKAFDDCQKDNNLLVFCQSNYYNCCIVKIKS